MVFSDSLLVVAGLAFDRFVRATRAEREGCSTRICGGDGSVPLQRQVSTPEEATLDLHEFTQLLRSQGAGTPYTDAQIVAEYEIASTVADAAPGVQRVDYVVYMLGA